MRCWKGLKVAKAAGVYKTSKLESGCWPVSHLPCSALFRVSVCCFSGCRAGLLYALLGHSRYDKRQVGVDPHDFSVGSFWSISKQVMRSSGITPMLRAIIYRGLNAFSFEQQRGRVE